MSLAKKPGPEAALHAVDFMGEQTLGEKQFIEEKNLMINEAKTIFA